MAVMLQINGIAGLAGWCFRHCEQGCWAKELQVVAVGDIVPADNWRTSLNILPRAVFRAGFVEEVVER